MPRAWTLISISEGRQYGGNLGYQEQPQKVYLYDSSVQNHRRVASGDLVFIRNQENVFGMARIEAIETSSGVKTRRRCPTCNTAAIKKRKNSTPRWRCSGGHVFHHPLAEDVPVNAFRANYANTYIALRNQISVQDLKDAALRPSDQVSIEQIDATALGRQIESAGTQARVLLEQFLQAGQPDPHGYSPSHDPNPPRSGDTYSPGIADTRERIKRSIALRKGQSTFRRKLIRRYGPACMISGCALMDIVEAAHIWPYRGERDNHPDNGLLLRADLHTLFDLDLLGIHPQTRTVLLHPHARSEGYSQFHDLPLTLKATQRPSAAALRSRWTAFTEHLRRRK